MATHKTDDGILPQADPSDREDEDVLAHVQTFHQGFRQLWMPELSLVSPEDALAAVETLDKLKAALERQRAVCKTLQQLLHQEKAKLIWRKR
jgi:hypothetical protein